MVGRGVRPCAAFCHIMYWLRVHHDCAWEKKLHRMLRVWRASPGLRAGCSYRLFNKYRGAMIAKELWISFYLSHDSSEIETVLKFQSIVVQTHDLPLIPLQLVIVPFKWHQRKEIWLVVLPLASLS
jgi:hypothetical protein